MFDIIQVGKRIRKLREKRKWTQGEIAQSLGLSVQAVSKWERGQNAPDLALLSPLSRLLDCSIDYLVEGEAESDENVEGTLLLSSLRGFAKESSGVSPRNLASRVNVLHQASTDRVLISGGIPIKYTGDGGLFFYSGPNHQSRALEAALDWFEILKYPELVVVACEGPVYLGLIGHQDYAQRDVLGESVNECFMLSAWLCDQGEKGLFCNWKPEINNNEYIPLSEKSIDISHGFSTERVWKLKK